MTPTSSNRVRDIESWFHDHEDGEFTVAGSDQRSEVLGDHPAPRTLIHTTKLHCLCYNLGTLDMAHPVTIVGRCGLPVARDLIYFNKSPVGSHCYFMGDADPPDILAFAWLREHAAIGWLGVNDELLNRNPDLPCASLKMAMSYAEKQAMRALPDLCPDFRDLLGPHCSAMLDLGFKIELEAAMMHLCSRRER